MGYKDSNLGMAGPKPAALPLGDTPTNLRSEIIAKLFINVNINFDFISLIKLFCLILIIV
ncbi:hypothetical protein HPMG_00557 [Helicobacter pullorum MIT 98-5489]|uniref:Uncharacterized protein n=1 Tax=Helicobacter pullorum MIT 98-5489 TaxID=537972 RepID=C5EYY5_9HELI|nr:hypothetical protein HPMG_00557 [Helicobacter pullorum MIT 98-5489]